MSLATRGASLAAAFGAVIGLACGACSLTRDLDDITTTTSSLRCESDADCADALCDAVEHTCRSCPADMSLIRFPDGDAFCIDRLEVTQQKYREFVDTIWHHPDIDLSEICQFNSEYTPLDEGDCEGSFQPELTPDRPVVCVDACDAQAYCLANGKRLCGGHGGSLIWFTRFNDVSHDQWFVACAGLENRLFPYGGGYSDEACNVTREHSEDVGNFSSCATPEGVLDLSGNVAEWTNACDVVDADSGVRCLVRGGSYQSAKPAVASCVFDVAQTPAIPPLMPPLSARLPSVGLRCCLD